MATRKIFLTKDTTATLADNFIVDEEYNIQPGLNISIVPKYGAFFTKDFQIKDINGNVVSKDNIIFTDLYEEATRLSGQAVYNNAVITNTSLTTKVFVTYRAYGGLFSRNANLLLDWVNEKFNEAVSPIDFFDLVDRPKEYTPKAHKHIWDEVYGARYIKPYLTRLENAIELDNSVFFNLLLEQIQNQLKEANEKASILAKLYSDNVINVITTNISKETLGLNLIANLSIADKEQMKEIAKDDFDVSTITEDKYINKKGLMAFVQELNDRSVNMEKTGLGLANNKIVESKKGSLLSLGNSGIITLNSKRAIIESGNFYEDNVYPKNYPETDSFTILKVTNNLSNHGGVFLGFNNSSGEMYSGVLTDDRCFMRIKWYKFYSELTYDKILDKLNEHINARNNPHHLTKKQVRLEKVVNLPVATLDQIMGDEPVDAYMTLDGLSAFMLKHLLDLKPEFNEDGSLKQDSDLFNKPNIIFTPCDKKEPNNCPPKGQILKTYCDGTDRFKRVADGNCGFSDEVLELNSDDCKYFEINPQGKVLYVKCEGVNKVAIIADGRGGTTQTVIEVNSEECGFITPIPGGTVIFEGCDGANFIRRTADGNGGVIEAVIEVNSERCGYTTTSCPPVGTVISEGCEGFNMVRVTADGKCNTITTVIAINSPDCGYTTSTTSTTSTTRTPGQSSTSSTTTTTTRTPGQPTIYHNRTPLSIKKGDSEHLWATFSNFTPNTTLTCRLEGKVISYSQQVLQNNPILYDWMDWGNTLTISVPIDGSGSGRWDLYQNDEGIIPAGTTWLARVVDSGSGTISNEITVVWPETATTTTTTNQPTDPYANMKFIKDVRPFGSSSSKYFIENGPPNGIVNLEFSGIALGYGYSPDYDTITAPPYPHTRFPVQLDANGWRGFYISVGGGSLQGAGQSGNLFVVEKPSLSHPIIVLPWSGA